MPPLMCNMINLQTLSDFILSENDGFRIKELGELQLLQGSLCISGLENVKDVKDVLEAKLKNKQHLSELILRWNGESDDSTKERKVLDALQPHVNLKELQIIGYRGTTLPNWVSHPMYCNLTKVFLIELANCCLLPSFKQLVSLRELRIERLDGFLGIHEEFCDASLTKSFQSFVRLELSRINMWKWSFINEGVPAKGNIFFPRLKRIVLKGCRELNVGLPVGNLPSLEEISISECNEMVAVFPSSSHIDTTYPSLETLLIDSCSRLESFSISGILGLPSTLKYLHIKGCNLLLANRMNWNLQRLSLLVRLTLSEYLSEELDMDSFPEEGLLPANLTSLRISYFKNIKALNGKGFQHLTSLQGLSVFNCDQLECLPSEGLPPTLISFIIDSCPLLTPRCQRGIGEYWPKIQHIPQIYINGKKIQ